MSVCKEFLREISVQITLSSELGGRGAGAEEDGEVDPFPFFCRNKACLL